ncbi:hypothetical protein SAMN05660690_2236 [Geodermatophilus telluris]|uniref:Uncharacterized protein n=1 Tax=Geodermatophilus telluris TaxID=1190417 RepID=A0A1G6NTS3_9ACTN|nr:hypothetical protein [Geodermatophilus telluris]SDC71332.1 hypothetical protein SAMN05660690_2236 [Geodermatophilus telluris]
MADLTIDRASGRRAQEQDHRAPDLPAPHQPAPDHVPPPPGPHGPPHPDPTGVRLARLTALARLTPAQAVELGADLLAEAAGAPEDAGAGGPDPLDRVLVDTDGRVHLDPTAGLSPAALAELLASTAAAARPRGRPAEGAAADLLARLDAAAADLPVAGVPAAAERLQEAARGSDRAAVRAELAALVRAVVAGPAAARALPPATPGRAVPARRSSLEPSGSGWRRVGGWLLSVVLLSAVVVVEVVVLRDDIAADVEVLLDAGRSGAEPTAAPEPDGLPVTPPAPAAAGDVAAVDLRNLAACTPGAPCTVRVQVRLVPGSGERQVSWTYTLVDRCTGATSTAPGGSVAVPAAGTRAEAVGVVALPAAPAVAVLAVTEEPAAAASAPLSVGSCRTDAPTG